MRVSCGAAIGLLLLVCWVKNTAANPREHVQYWQQNYEELRAAEDPRAARAHEIFARLVQAADRRAEVLPRLFIIKSDPWDLAFPVALPDGWVLLSKKVLDFCYHDPLWGEDRLAFVLAHEIAHILQDDFWHMRFFQLLKDANPQAAGNLASLQEVLERLPTSEEIWAKEFRADERGMVYAAMAGFHTPAIVTEDKQVNFFRDWVQGLDPRRLHSVAAPSPYPTPQERAAAVTARLQHIVNQVAVFQTGLQFYQAGNYVRAIQAFEQFQHAFPSREAWHNLAVSHHQLALQAYRLWKSAAQEISFRLSLVIDPVTRASRVALSGGRDGTSADPAWQFRTHLNTAIDLYARAMARDPSYLLAYNNLGCALILREDYYEAIATLQKALKLAPQNPEVLNNLGIAFFYIDKWPAAKTYLQQAHALAPAYSAPVWNLGHLAQAEQQADEAQRYWTAARRLDPFVAAPEWVPGTAEKEHLRGLTVASAETSVPALLGTPSQTLVPLAEDSFLLSRYARTAMTLSRHGLLHMLVALEGYPGQSARGIAIGSSDHDVLARYGAPSRVLEMTQGANWSYDEPGIAFQFRHRQVVSWLLF
jgi:tetratricopeptide (TPR) repeat protein